MYYSAFPYTQLELKLCARLQTAFIYEKRKYKVYSITAINYQSSFYSGSTVIVSILCDLKYSNSTFSEDSY